MFRNHLPRYWVGWYDRWHLLLLLLFVILACFLVYLITLPATPPTLQTANPGAVLEAGKTLELSGTAPAGSPVHLWDSGKRVDETRADARGAYRFIVPNIAAGAHAFKTVVDVNGNAVESTVLNLTASVPVVMLQPTATAAPSATATLPPTATPTAALVAGTVQRRGKDNAEMVYVPAGEFTAGAGVTQTVYLEAYWLDRLEVTNEQFEQFVQSAGYKTEAEKIGTGYDYVGAKWEQFPGLTWLTPRVGGSIADKAKNPVAFVSWNDASAYCVWAGKRLPTEAEWEKAARGTDGRDFPWGSMWDATRLNFCDGNCSYAWKENGNDGYAESAPVGSYLQGASPYSALDMAGNVWEWVADWFSAGYPKNLAARNPTGPASGDTKVLRGGAWSIGQAFARTTGRFNKIPAFRERSVGMRCAQ